MRWLLPIPFLLGCTPKPIVPPPVFPDLERTQWDHDPGVPPLPSTPPDGPHAVVPLHLAVLDQVGLDHWNAIAEHLAADPRWRLQNLDGAVVAFARHQEQGTWVVEREGYRRTDQAVTRTDLRFLSWKRGNPWETSPAVVHVPASAAKADLRLFRLPAPWPAWDASALDVRGVDLSLEVFEARAGTTRPRTTAAAASTATYVADLLQHVDTIRAKGRFPAEMPPGEPTRGGDSLSLSRVRPGILELRARVNPGAPGWTWLRVIDTHGKAWAADPVAVGTREAVGWSSDPSERFYMEARFPVPLGPAFRGTAELWFLGPSRHPERVLVKRIRVPAR